MLLRNCKAKIVISLMILPNLISFSSAQVLFSENFESYAVGSNLNGQGGWAGQYRQIINTSPFLPGHVSDGEQQVVANLFSEAYHQLPAALNPNRVTTLTFDAYSIFTASTNYPTTHDSVMGIFKSSNSSGCKLPITISSGNPVPVNHLKTSPGFIESP